jgi:hypothetical protein
MREILKILEAAPVRLRETDSRRSKAAAGARTESVTATRLVLTAEVAAEFRAVLVTAGGEERVVDVRVEFPEGARALLLAARWRGGSGILHTVRDAGVSCLRRIGAERLLDRTVINHVTVRASIDDIRHAIGEV